MATFKLDKTDIQILSKLQANSKVTNLKLSKDVGLSPAPTLERVKKLEKVGVIKSYHAQVDPTKVGMTVQTFVMVKLDWTKKTNLQSFIKKIQSIPEILECYRITGDADCMLRVVAKDIPAYETLMVETLAKLDEVSGTSSHMVLSTNKDTKVMPLSLNR